MADRKLKKRALHRARILQGQISGLIKAIESEAYCPDLLGQSLSIRRSLKSLDAFLLENHLRTHVRRQMQDRSDGERAVKELIKIYTLAHG